MKSKNHPFGSLLESFLYPLLLLAIMWLVFWAEQLFPIDFHTFGVLPKTIEGLKGIIFMPLLHAKNDVNHIINNSFPTFVLLAAIIYFYREIALKVFILLWIGTGVMLWLYAQNTGSYHIGMSGVIYGMLGFVFTSGVLRKYIPLQAISLFVVFVYGNLVWGIFPIKAHVSWEGHFMGLVVGFLVAILFRSKSTQRPKYQFEVEQEMGIEPPDLEGMWIAEQERIRLYQEEQQRIENGYLIVYDYVPNEEVKPQDDTGKES